jgi:glucosamine-6-phosphate deaminase
VYLITADEAGGVARVAAGIAASIFRADPDSAVVVATGNTPVATYAELVNLYRSRFFRTDRLRVFQLDEYLDIGPDDPRSLYAWMARSFLDPLDIAEHNVVRFAPDGDAGGGAERTCSRYSASLAQAGGYGLAILGLGPNGHLGFNEPPSDATSTTRAVTLTRESLVSNGRYWGSGTAVPERALTAGMDVLLAAHQILLLVSGAHKRQILAATMRGPVTDAVPASHLQGRPNVIVVADREAVGG